ncbi:hypothetical protein J2046_004162 [Rhizobium petrolearium]|uniref:hypothetical protein n=1 Tax=Neorhizobium petrolearium TaxID=515361 RepID=UPI001AE939AA|nr:hypothetical protein [Neorhizobium petrolearium]MBP1845888.1 hypothetical protein [Neorhizobium petrolearium]
MSRPAFLTIKHVKCYSINDYTGSDDLFGVMGPVRFRIGSFSPGDDRSVEINQIVPSGEFYLRIIEDDATGDDELGLIDLSEVMDFDTTKNVQSEDANYDITYFVQSMSS